MASDYPICDNRKTELILERISDTDTTQVFRCGDCDPDFPINEILDKTDDYYRKALEDNFMGDLLLVKAKLK